jgi:hypothetical protein
MIMRYGDFGAEFTRDAEGRLILDATNAVREGTDIRGDARSFEVSARIKAPGFTAESLRAAVESATKSTLDSRISSGATVQTYWTVEDQGWGSWFRARQMIAVGRALPTPVMGSAADLDAIGALISPIPGIVAVEMDNRVITTQGTEGIPGGEIGQDRRTIEETPKDNTKLYLGLGAAAVAAYFLLRK